MHIRRSPDTLTISDPAGCFWFLGLFLFVPGLLGMAAVLGLASNAGELALWERALAFLIAAGVAAGGFHVLRTSPQTVVRVGGGELVVRRRGLLVRGEERYALRDVAAITVRTDRDSDGDPVYQLRLWLRDSREIALSRLWLHDRDGTRAAAAALHGFLGLPAPAAPPPEELPPPRTP